jgi:hypothetical protein
MTCKTRSQKMILIFSSFVLVMTILTGCVSQKSLTKKDKESIRSVSINKQVKMPDDFLYMGPAQAWGVAGGLIGAMAGQSDARSAKAQIKTAMQENQIDLEQISREQLEAELLKANLFPSIVPEGGDAEIRLEVRLFGLVQKNSFSAQLKPTLGITGILVGSNGTVFWQKYDYITAFNDQTPEHTIEEYLKNPQFLREAFITSAKVISEGLVKDIRLE